MQYTKNTTKHKKQNPRWDSSPGMLSDFFPPKLPEPCPPPPVQANTSLAEQILNVCQHYEMKCAGLEVSQGYLNAFGANEINPARTRLFCDLCHSSTRVRLQGICIIYPGMSKPLLKGWSRNS